MTQLTIPAQKEASGLSLRERAAAGDVTAVLEQNLDTYRWLLRDPHRSRRSAVRRNLVRKAWHTRRALRSLQPKEDM